MSASELFLICSGSVGLAFVLTMLIQHFVNRWLNRRAARRMEMEEIEEFANDPSNPKWKSAKWKEP